MRRCPSATEKSREALTCPTIHSIIRYHGVWRVPSVSRQNGRADGNYLLEEQTMETKHIVTLETRDLCASAKNGGCGECQTSCQSACKTSCGIANQQCENSNR